jgi:hypothetical protein
MIWSRSMLEVRTRGTTSYDAATVRIHGYFSFLYLCLSAVSEGFDLKLQPLFGKRIICWGRFEIKAGPPGMGTWQKIRH